MRRIRSKSSDLVANVKKLMDCFREWGYSEDMVNKETKRGLETPSLGCSKISEKSGTGVPLMVNYNLFLSRLGQVICKNWIEN